MPELFFTERHKLDISLLIERLYLILNEEPKGL